MESDTTKAGGLGVVVVLGLLVAGGFYLLSHMQAPPTTSQAPQVQPVNPAAKIKLYLFSTDPCPACKTLHAAMEDPAVREAMKRFELIEITKRDRIKEKLFKIKSYPTLVAVSAKGTSSHTGSMDAKDLAAWLNGIQ